MDEGKPPYLLVIIEAVHKTRATEFYTLTPNFVGRQYGTNLYYRSGA
jgi:hypothetical protein